MKLPPDIPPDASFLYSYIDVEHNLLKITVTHESFEERDFDCFAKGTSVTIEPGTEKPEDISPSFPPYDVQLEDCNRIV